LKKIINSNSFYFQTIISVKFLNFDKKTILSILIYNFSIKLYSFLIWAASFFNQKANKMIIGRKNLLQNLAINFKQNNSPIAWFHCASLGEFEQGRPVIEAFKAEYKNYKILLTFFSPSGYEIQKNYPGADFIQYLPLDTTSNVTEFLAIVKPEMAIFVKYEFWYNYLNGLQKANIPTYLISANFRKDQIFFKKYGGFFRKILFKFDHIFVQNDSARDLLQSIDYDNVTLAGDTRFDRVFQLSKNIKQLPIIEKFKSKHQLFVVGSAWAEDIEFLLPYINAATNCKVVIAPHEIKLHQIELWKTKIKAQSIQYSQIKEGQNIENIKVLFIDNIGMLSSIYNYADICWIGGAFGGGLHNILEAATFGKPIFFGNKNYQKFAEAVDLIENGGAFALNNFDEFNIKINNLLQNNNSYNFAAEASKTYVVEHIGATNTIMNYINKHHKQ
jgi:3-deoxy-D-manno-octulosonic-acid transferase